MEASPATPLTIIMVEDNPLDVSLVRWVRTAHFEQPNHLNECMHPGDLITDLAFGNPPTFTQNNEVYTTLQSRYEAVCRPRAWHSACRRAYCNQRGTRRFP